MGTSEAVLDSPTRRWSDEVQEIHM